MAARRRRRSSRPGDRPTALALARRHTLAPIVAADPAHAARLRAAPDRYRLDLAWDGHRVLAVRQGATVRLASADHRDWAELFAAIAHVIARLPCEACVIEGVVCAFDDAGRPTFARLREQAAARDAADVVLVAWDLLHQDGEDLRSRPLAERLARLAALCPPGATRLRVAEPLPGGLDAVLAAVGAHGLRGVVARELAAPHPTDDAAWASHAAGPAPVSWDRSLSPPPPLTNATKLLYPRDGITKADVVGYYAEIAPVLLAHLRDRPVVCQRWPDGIDEFTWYQHRVPPRAPDYLRAAWVDGVRRLILDNTDALMWMVNQAALTLHTFGSRVATLAEPDWAMIDLDPGDATSWRDTVDVAIAVRRALELLELPSVVKTSGQRGLHVLVPLAPGHTFAQAEALAHGVATMVARLLPDRVTLELDKDKRRGRLLVDHKQFAAKTLVAPYALRGIDAAPASCPLGWDEVTAALDPRGLGIRTIRARIDRHGDRAAALLAGTAVLAPALARLAAARR